MSLWHLTDSSRTGSHVWSRPIRRRRTPDLDHVTDTLVLLPADCFRDLLRHTFSRWMRGHAQPQDFAPVMPQDQQAEQKQEALMGTSARAVAMSSRQVGASRRSERRNTPSQAGRIGRARPRSPSRSSRNQAERRAHIALIE